MFSVAVLGLKPWVIGWVAATLAAVFLGPWQPHSTLLFGPKGKKSAHLPDSVGARPCVCRECAPQRRGAEPVVLSPPAADDRGACGERVAGQSAECGRCGGADRVSGRSGRVGGRQGGVDVQPVLAPARVHQRQRGTVTHGGDVSTRVRGLVGARIWVRECAHTN